MAATVLPPGGVALYGAPDSDMSSKDSTATPTQVMQLEITHDLVDELLESVRSGRSPQIVFGRKPTLKYGDKSHVLQTSLESHRYELYLSSGAGNDDDLEFAGLINHRLAVQEAENAAAGVDSALEQLKSSMAAMAEMKEANKTIVGNVTPARTPGHKRLTSRGFKPSHLGPSSLGSPMNMPASPGLPKKAPTSQPGGMHELVLQALRAPLVHLLAVQPCKETKLAELCRTSIQNIRELLPKIGKPSPNDAELWSLSDKGFREINPFKFQYKSDEDRGQAINAAIKAFDRQRLTKDDKLWQILLPVEERGKGICLSRLNVRAVELPKAGTPMHKVPGLTDKKKAAGGKKEKNEAKDKELDQGVKKVKDAKEVEPKQRKVVKDEPARKAGTPNTAKAASSAPSQRNTPSTPAVDSSKIRAKKVNSAAPSSNSNSAPRVKKAMAPRDNHQRDRYSSRPVVKPPVNTKPKNPSPLSASPPVNASDFEDDHPVHKALSAAPSPAKPSSGNSDRALKRKANDLDSDIHNHSLSVKQARIDRPTPGHTPNGRTNGSTPSSGNSLKRKAEDSSTSNTPTLKVRKVANIDTHVANRYSSTHSNNTQISPGDSSSTTTSPSIPSLSFRQTVELSQTFQKSYKKYEELYWRLAESDRAPSQSQRDELMKMHKKLEEMKREIKAGSSAQR